MTHFIRSCILVYREVRTSIKFLYTSFYFKWGDDLAKYCDDGCHAVCDFCKFYEDDEEDGEFFGEGFCLAKKERVFASWHCTDDFECFRMKD